MIKNFGLALVLLLALPVEAQAANEPQEPAGLATLWTEAEEWLTAAFGFSDPLDQSDEEAVTSEPSEPAENPEIGLSIVPNG